MNFRRTLSCILIALAAFSLFAQGSSETASMISASVENASP